MAWRFEVLCEGTCYGEQLAAVGSCVELGCWDTSKALKLRSSLELFPQWFADFPALQAGSEFKLVICGPDSVKWESFPSGGNRCWPSQAFAPNGSILRTSFGEKELQILAPDLPTLPPAPPAPPALRRLRFKETVSCCEILPLSWEEKRHFFWQDDELAEFLKVRMAIATRFKLAKRHNRISANGTWEMGADLPESRRGLGLGRERQRLASMRNYMGQVTSEQARQVHEGTFPDWDSFSKVARDASTADARHAIEEAGRDAATVIKDREARSSEGGSHEAVEAKSLEPHNIPCDVDQSTKGPGMIRVASFVLADGAMPLLADRLEPRRLKGFGHLKESLEEAGFAANGKFLDASEEAGTVSPVRQLECESFCN